MLVLKLTDFCLEIEAIKYSSDKDVFEKLSPLAHNSFTVA